MLQFMVCVCGIILHTGNRIDVCACMCVKLDLLLWTSVNKRPNTYILISVVRK